MTQAIASVVTAVGVVFAGISVRGGLVQRHRQFEALYIQRYWSLLDRLSNEAVLGDRRSTSSDDRLVLRLYFQLCQDEIEMYKRGWITERTFDEWCQGIVATMKTEPFASEWTTHEREFESGEGLKVLDDLRRLVMGDMPRREISRITALMRGL